MTIISYHHVVSSRSRTHLVNRTVIALVLAAILARPSGKAQQGESPQIIVRGEPVPSPTPWDDRKAKLDHIMSEVSGTEITVTKKATVIKLEQQPPIQNNNLQEQFTKAPGLI